MATFCGAFFALLLLRGPQLLFRFFPLIVERGTADGTDVRLTRLDRARGLSAIVLLITRGYIVAVINGLAIGEYELKTDSGRV